MNGLLRSYRFTGDEVPICPGNSSMTALAIRPGSLVFPAVFAARRLLFCFHRIEPLYSIPVTGELQNDVGVRWASRLASVRQKMFVIGFWGSG
jgi:hypothetical protein